MKAHRFDPLSFLAGLVFTALGVAAMGGVLDDVESLRIGWPLVLIGFGVLLVGSTFGGRDRELAPVDAPPQPTEALDEALDRAPDEAHDDADV